MMPLSSTLEKLPRRRKVRAGFVQRLVRFCFEGACLLTLLALGYGALVITWGGDWFNLLRFILP